MRILIVNSNTSQSVTETVAKEAARSCLATTEIVAQTAPFGPSAIENAQDAEIAGEATLSAFLDKGDGFDAGIIACFSDPGLDACKQSLSYPVVGIAEASIAEASILRGRFSIVTVAPTTIAPIRALVEKYGRTGQLASVRAHDQGVLGAHSDVDGTIAAFRELIDKAVHEDGAEIIILGGAVTAGMKRELQPTSPVPILDGLDCAIRYAEKLHSSRA